MLIAHPATPVFLLGNLFFLNIFLYKKGIMKSFISKFLICIVIFGSVAIVYLYLSGLIEYYIPFLSHHLTMDAIQVNISKLAGRIFIADGYGPYVFLFYLKLTLLFALFILAIIGFRILSKSDKKISMALLGISIGSICMGAILIYEREIFDRIVLFLLFPLIISTAMGLKRVNDNIKDEDLLEAEHSLSVNKKLFVVLSVFILLLMPFHILTHYGYERASYVSPANIEGVNFVYGNVPHSSTVGGGGLLYYKNLEKYNVVYVLWFWEEGKELPP
ncbi:MAG: hypothetical protein JSW28_02695, partial [Thermoplasmata archaeon]